MVEVKSDFPVFKYSGRRSFTIRLPTIQITDDRLLTAIQAFSSEDAVLVQEFTTVLDVRGLTTVGFLIELAKPLGAAEHTFGTAKLLDALVTTYAQSSHAKDDIGLPTIRIVRAGTFAEYRQWKQMKGKSVSLIKIPTVLLDLSVQAWFLESVVQEL